MTFFSQAIKRDFSSGQIADLGDFWQQDFAPAPVSANSSAGRVPEHAHASLSSSLSPLEGRRGSLSSTCTPLSGLSSSLPLQPEDLPEAYQPTPGTDPGAAGLLNHGASLPLQSVQSAPQAGLNYAQMPLADLQLMASYGRQQQMLLSSQQHAQQAAADSSLPERCMQDGSQGQGLPSVCSLDNLRQSHERLLAAASQFHSRGGVLAQGAFGDMMPDPEPFKQVAGGERWSGALPLPAADLAGMPNIVPTAPQHITFSDPLAVLPDRLSLQNHTAPQMPQLMTALPSLSPTPPTPFSSLPAAITEPGPVSPAGKAGVQRALRAQRAQQLEAINGVETEGESEPRPAGVLDQRRLRRMLSNRESARRSRKRKQALMVDLESENEKLAAENARLMRELAAAQRQAKAAVNDRKSMEAELAAVRKQMAEMSRHQPQHQAYPLQIWASPSSPGDETEASWSDAPVRRRPAQPRKRRSQTSRKGPAAKLAGPLKQQAQQGGMMF